MSRFDRHGDASVGRRLALVDSADHFVAHAVAAFARFAGRDRCAVVVDLSVVEASCIWSFCWNQTGRNRCGGFFATVVSGRAAAGLREHREASVHVQLAVLEYACAAVPDAVADLAGLLGVAWHASALRVMPSVHVAA